MHFIPWLSHPALKPSLPCSHLHSCLPTPRRLSSLPLARHQDRKLGPGCTPWELAEPLPLRAGVKRGASGTHPTPQPRQAQGQMSRRKAGHEAETGLLLFLLLLHQISGWTAFLTSCPWGPVETVLEMVEDTHQEIWVLPQLPLPCEMLWTGSCPCPSLNLSFPFSPHFWPL